MFNRIRKCLITITHKYIQQICHKSTGRQNCIPIQDLYPRCHKKNPDLIKCMKEKENYGEAIENFPFRHLLERPDCCLDECPTRSPRFDDLYWIPSDKQTRLYTRTWTECKSPLCKPKLFCCYEKKTVPYKKRKRGSKVDGVACESKKSDILMECNKQSKQGDCPTFVLPYCKPARKPPKCAKTKLPSDCCKICTPYPSFSECDKPKFKKKPIRECECQDKPDLCSIYDMLKKGLIKPIKRFRIK